MDEVKDMVEKQANYYALLIAILTKATAKDALMAMHICPDSEKEENINV